MREQRTGLHEIVCKVGKACKVEKVRSTFHTFHNYLNFFGKKKDDGLLTIYQENLRMCKIMI